MRSKIQAYSLIESPSDPNQYTTFLSALQDDDASGSNVIGAPVAQFIEGFRFSIVIKSLLAGIPITIIRVIMYMDQEELKVLRE